MKHFSPIGLFAAVALMVCVSASAFAQSDKFITVEINKGEMIKLDRPAASIVVADPATADVQIVSPKLLFVHGKKVGQTSLYAIDGMDEPILNTTIDVTHDISELERTIKRVAPDAEITFKTVDGGMVMDGFASSIAESENIRNVAAAFIGDKEKMVNMIRTSGSDQVMLKVKIVEMARNDLKKFGINLANAITRGNMSLSLLQGADIAADAGGNVTRGTGNTDSTVFGRITRGGFSANGLIDALETQGLANTLAEPSLTTTSGKAASFLAGGQFPLPVKDQQGAITIQYKPFGVSLNFTPVVMAHDRMSITVAPEVSTLNFDNPIQVAGITYPILLTRQASATVELGSGDTFALAGLLQNETSNNINKFPGLGDVPILGTLFRSHQFQNNETELVILVTPYIVHPIAERAQARTPVDGFTPPSDFQRLLLGNLYQQEPLSDADKAEFLPRTEPGKGGKPTIDEKAAPVENKAPADSASDEEEEQAPVDEKKPEPVKHSDNTPAPSNKPTGDQKSIAKPDATPQATNEGGNDEDEIANAPLTPEEEKNVPTPVPPSPLTENTPVPDALPDTKTANTVPAPTPVSEQKLEPVKTKPQAAAKKAPAAAKPKDEETEMTETSARLHGAGGFILE